MAILPWCRAGSRTPCRSMKIQTCEGIRAFPTKRASNPALSLKPKPKSYNASLRGGWSGGQARPPWAKLVVYEKRSASLRLVGGMTIKSNRPGDKSVKRVSRPGIGTPLGYHPSRDLENCCINTYPFQGTCTPSPAFTGANTIMD